VLLPRQISLPPILRVAQGRWLALLPAALVAAVIGAIAAAPGTADFLTYLALVGVPPLAALALGALCHGSRPWYALAALPLFVLAWAEHGTLLGEGSALALSALSCVALGSALVAATPARWVKAGIYLMAAIDVWLVASDLLQGPNSVLGAASPGGGLPRLQSVFFGSATMGYGDLFIAAAVGALLAGNRGLQLRGAAVAAVAGLLFDLLFFWVNELPATVPLALTLAIMELWSRRNLKSGRRPLAATAAGGRAAEHLAS